MECKEIQKIYENAQKSRDEFCDNLLILFCEFHYISIQYIAPKYVYG